MGQSDKFYPAGGDQLDVDLLGFLQLEPHVLLLLLQPVVLILQLFQLSDLISIFFFLRLSVVTAPEDKNDNCDAQESKYFNTHLSTFFL